MAGRKWCGYDKNIYYIWTCAFFKEKNRNINLKKIYWFYLYTYTYNPKLWRSRQNDHWDLLVCHLSIISEFHSSERPWVIGSGWHSWDWHAEFLSVLYMHRHTCTLPLIYIWNYMHTSVHTSIHINTYKRTTQWKQNYLIT